MDSEDDSNNSIPREITTMSSQPSTLEGDGLSLASTPRISPRELAEVTNLTREVKELRSEIDQLKGGKQGSQTTEGEKGSLVFRSVDVCATNKAVKDAIDK